MKSRLTSPSITANRVRMLRSLHSGAFFIVEGKGDKLLFEKYLFNKDIKIIMAGDKNTVIDVLTELENEELSGIVGVVDDDHDRILGITYKLNSLIISDHYNIESMLIKSPSLDRLLNEYGDQKRIATLQKRCGKDIRNIITESGIVLGCLRLYSKLKKINLDFKDLKYNRFIDRDTLEIDTSACIENVKNNSQRHDLNTKLVSSEIAMLLEKQYDPWDLCNGHDLVHIIKVGLRRAIGKKTSSSKEELERGLRLGFHKEDFETTEVYKKLIKWEETNIDYRLIA